MQLLVRHYHCLPMPSAECTKCTGLPLAVGKSALCHVTHHMKRYFAGVVGPTQALGSGVPIHGIVSTAAAAVPAAAPAAVPGLAVPCCRERAHARSMAEATRNRSTRPPIPRVQAILSAAASTIASMLNECKPRRCTRTVAHGYNSDVRPSLIRALKRCGLASQAPDRRESLSGPTSATACAVLHFTWKRCTVQHHVLLRHARKLNSQVTRISARAAMPASEGAWEHSSSTQATATSSQLLQNTTRAVQAYTPHLLGQLTEAPPKK